MVHYRTMSLLQSILTIDYGVHDWFIPLRSDVLTSIFSAITFVGDGIFIFLVLCSVSLVLYRNTVPRQFVVPLWVSFVSAEGITFILKALIARQRPLYGLVVEHNFSFPSGHATVAVALYGFLVYIGSKYFKKLWMKYMLFMIGVVVIFLIGVSRLYLGVHYVSDVIAGYCVGAIGFALGVYVYQSQQHCIKE